MGREPGQATGGPRVGTIPRHGRSVGAPSQLRTPRRQSSHPAVPVPCHGVHVHCLTVLGDGPCVVQMARAGRSTGAPCPLWTLRHPSFHPAVSLHYIKTWTCHSRGATVWHLPHQDLPWRSKPARTMEIQASSHNGYPKPVHTIDIQSRFTQWRSRLVHTKEFQASSHNGDPGWFTQW